MKPAPPDPAELLQRVRRQLILAQVRILELEDIRDDRATRAKELDQLLTSLQAKADLAASDLDHLKGVHEEGLRYRDHLQHLLHLSTQEVATMQARINTVNAALESAAARETELRAQIAKLGTQVAELVARIATLERERAEFAATSAARLERINQLDAELRAMKASPSWRWTKWLRGLDRLFRRG